MMTKRMTNERARYIWGCILGSSYDTGLTIEVNDTCYNVTLDLCDETPSQCGGTQYDISLRKSYDEEPERSYIPRYPSFDTGITVLTISCLDYEPLSELADALPLVVEGSDNISGGWAIQRGARGYNLRVLVHVVGSSREPVAADEDSGLSIKISQYESPYRPPRLVPETISRRGDVIHDMYFYDPYSTATVPWIASLQPIRGDAVFLSSNVGDAGETTADVVMDLARHKLRVATDYGYSVIAPPYMATNPNEGNHYIYGAMVVFHVLDAGEFSSTYVYEPETEEEDEYYW